ncbi:MAG: hypothetical protein HDR85_08270 [Bacteroides sp.]|nr:hypothetical protein [Bacteroides sp.]
MSGSMLTPAAFSDELPRTAREMFIKWGRFLYSTVDFNMPDSPLHAKSHCERVLFHALMMGAMEMGDDVEALEILAHASIFHDTRRQDEYLDTGHGARAAVHYEDFCREHPDEIVFHPEAVYLMRYHDLDDSRGIKAIRKAFPDRSERVGKLYAIFKDADALDRWRLGRWGLDEKYLRTPSSHRLVGKARELVGATMNPKILAYYDNLIDTMMQERKGHHD